jgi:hypothetical protein
MAFEIGGRVVSRVTYGSKWGRVRTVSVKDGTTSTKSAEEIVRNMKEEERKLPKEAYRERSLDIHGLVCARCGRDFNESQRHLLTVHHKDGNHHHNPPDGSNWENLCIYCHEDVHSRGLLGDYLEGISGRSEYGLVYGDHDGEDKSFPDAGSLGEKLKKAIQKKEREG